MIVNQWVPAAHQGDAIGDSARRVRDMLRTLGHVADIFAITIDDSLRHDIRPFDAEEATGGDLTIFHYALPSPMTEAFAALSGRRVLQYHNITPAHFFAPYEPELFRLAELGRRELATLAGRVDLALGDSEYNRRELDELGFGDTGVMPIAVDTERLSRLKSRPALEGVLDDGLTNILFVGRLAPNKKIEDHILLAEHYRRYVDSNYRFIFVGRNDAAPRYFTMIRSLVSEFNSTHGEIARFWFTGSVPDDDLVTFYRHADAYVSLSEHEGFCVPLLEAMAAEVPVMAYPAGAIPETLADAGVQFAPKNFEYAAELLGLLVYDEDLRSAVLAGQRARLENFGDAMIRQHLAQLVERFS